MKMTQAQADEHQRKHGFPVVGKDPVMVTVLPPGTLPLIISSPERIDFFMEFMPPEVTSQQKGVRVVVPTNGTRPFPSFFTKSEVVKAEKAIAVRLLPFKPAKPFDGPLRLISEWTWAWRASEPKKNRVAGWAWRATMPDFDNISKLLCDQMAALQFFHNDSQIADARVTKQWGDRPGIRITLEALDNP